MNTPLTSPEKATSHPKTQLILTSLFAAAAMSACSTSARRSHTPVLATQARLVERVEYTRTVEVQGNTTISGHPRARAVDTVDSSISPLSREIQMTEERLWLLRQAEARRRQSYLDSTDPWTARELEIREENRILREARRQRNLSGY